MSVPVNVIVRDGGFARDDWNVRIKTTARMTATKTDFHLKASEALNLPAELQ